MDESFHEGDFPLFVIHFWLIKLIPFQCIISIPNFNQLINQCMEKIKASKI